MARRRGTSRRTGSRSRRGRSNTKVDPKTIGVLLVLGVAFFIIHGIGAIFSYVVGGASPETNFLVGLAVVITTALVIYRQWSKKQDQLRRALKIADIDSMTGLQFEEYLAFLLRDRGFNVENIRGSNDFGVDLIAQQGPQRIAIQAKRYSRPISRTAISDAVAGMQHHGCNSSMVITNNRFTKSAKEFATSTNCTLIDRDILANWLLEYQQKKQKSPVDSIREPDIG